MLALGLALLALAADPPPPSQPAATPDASLARIARALEPPSRLQITVPQPTFKVEIQQHPYFDYEPRPWDFGGGGTPFVASTSAAAAAPLVQVDVLPWLRRAWSAWNEHTARDEVRRALTDFCASSGCSPR